MIFAPIAVILCVILVLYAIGIKINTSPSLPRGVWRVVKINPELLQIGDTIMVNRTAVPGAPQHLLKDFAAMSGDVMSSENGFVYRNGLKMLLSEIYKTNSKGKAVDQVNYPLTVPAQYIWLSSRHSRGYDSRYFGPVPNSTVIGKATLLWAW